MMGHNYRDIIIGFLTLYNSQKFSTTGNILKQFTTIRIENFDIKTIKLIYFLYIFYLISTEYVYVKIYKKIGTENR